MNKLMFSGDSVQAAETVIANFLMNELGAYERNVSSSVLWLISGGSAIEVECRISQRIANHPKISNLQVMLIDERFGAAGHKDSNAEQLRQKGFALPFLDVLQTCTSLNDVKKLYEKNLVNCFEDANIVIACLGLGADGHTAGVLPGSTAAKDLIAPVVAYEWQDFTRITAGLNYISQIDEAYVFAYGDNKRDALNRLQANTEPLEWLPAKVLYEISETTVYNDTISKKET